jgi:hypothetical protein
VGEVELRIALGQYLFCLFAFGNVDVDACHASRAPIVVVNNKTTRLDPTNLAAGANNSILRAVVGPLLPDCRASARGRRVSIRRRL